MRSLATFPFLALCLITLACGPKPKNNFIDAGEEDAGTPAIDAGRPAGEMPPTGYSRALEQPAAPAGTRVGVSLAMVLDQHEQPLVAYLQEDPNGDGVRQDDRVVFTRWNGVDKAWQAPKTVDVSGQVDHELPHRQLSLARDAVTGRLGIAYVTAASTVKLATSEDEGETWMLEVASAANPSTEPLGDPQLAMHGGTVHLAFWQENRRCTGQQCAAVVYRTRTGNGPGGFGADQLVPLPAGADGNLAMPLSLALDATGKPGLAYFAGTSAGTPVTVAFWRPGTASASSVFDSGTAADTTPSLSLAFDGEKPRLAYHLSSSAPEVQLRYSAAADSAGASWAAPVGIPRNGAAPETTRYFQSLAMGPAGKVAIAAAFTLASQPPQQCGGPKLARSSDGTSFTVCSPDGARVFGFAGHYLTLAFARSGKLTLSFLYETATNPSMGPGVVLWREP